MAYWPNTDNATTTQIQGINARLKKNTKKQLTLYHTITTFNDPIQEAF